MTDCPLAAAIRNDWLTPSGRSGSEIVDAIATDVERVLRVRPWLVETREVSCA